MLEDPLNPLNGRGFDMTREPNRALARLMAEAEWGNGQLARAVNRTGAEAGMELSYSASTV
ncbi:hypothetical protein ACGFX2_39440, partial [Streptomyces goshikiensis]|uniref:hypothetical protein n=1 Tax=Streptomyces goshikiensis TaxID=1942 RepID=UPI00371368DA